VNVAKSNYLDDMMDNHKYNMANFEASKKKDKKEHDAHSSADRLACTIARILVVLNLMQCNAY
jgi:hypothetical protein